MLAGMLWLAAADLHASDWHTGDTHFNNRDSGDMHAGLVRPGEPQIWSLEFEGNDRFGRGTLRSIIATNAPSLTRRLRFWNRSGFEFSETEIRRDVIRIERHYQRRGFPDVRVEYDVRQGSRDWQRELTFIVHEGEPIRIDHVEVRLMDDSLNLQQLREYSEFRRAERSHPMQQGDRYELIRHSDVESHYLSTLRNLGYAFARVEVSSDVDEVNKSARLFIELDPGPVVRFGDILVEGQETVSGDLVRRQSSIQPGDRFSQDKLQSAQRALFGHPLFRFATVNTVDQARDSTVNVSIRVREQSLRSIELQGGFGTEELLRGAMTWQHRNPFGNAHRFSVNLRGSFIEQRANLSYYLPYIFNPESRFVISPFGQRLDESGYTLLRGGITNSFIYQHSERLTGSLSYELTRNALRVEGAEQLDRDVELLYNASIIELTGLFNQYPAEQDRGWNIRPSVEFSGFLDTGTFPFERLVLDARRFIDLTGGLKLALRAHAGAILADDELTLPEHVRFFTGGTGSIRGWGRRQLGPKRALLDDEGAFLGYVPLGGRAMLTGNTELRQDLDVMLNNLGMAVFLDGGQIWRITGNVDLSDVQYALGGGLRYDSPIGPIRLDAGYKLNPTDEDLNRFQGKDFGSPLDRWGFHFSIGHSF